MNESTKQQSSYHKRYGQVWLFFMYYWLIFGISVYFGQYLPAEWRQPMSIGLAMLILITMVLQRARFSGPIISHIYTIVAGLLSYATFMYSLANLGGQTFLMIVSLAVTGFVVFGILGFFVIRDASGMGKYLFVTLIALICMSIVAWIFHVPMLYTVISVVGLGLFLLYTLYDFNRLKRGAFAPREMGFNLFLNLFRIIRHALNLAQTMRR
ncbi:MULTISPECIES: Bax inhibitor-1 family protein [unclassified Staphylococcus]|uniref:Bax inhibitor-1/YccA family protein n=1 Tax=unclassified Staphylococcus TaxID=91994 RepID=UPI0021D3A308|nr:MULTISPECIES: Bax inhibitor-1 family protein [unclassified Staphylococcus]UXR69921.1 Bax inhibitor-1 family protein [Staphylococcus sp. IVB6246]UXR71960.1 Bax inhibitor-1 family protein [Staphylococcus sp. IVB6240]UXR76656.1 Bax inhibitor-1 family protein [Staphylococcus sp. IVB6233]UXR80785.1 Bax inhibitor-1 family protein [Staphylococcus sp. IVB6218]